MLVALVVLLTLVETPFGSSVDRALGSAQNGEWKQAMTALDQAWIEDPAGFQANNLHYLRGRVAEEQQDWLRALDDFSKIDPKNPLRPLAAWHGASAAMKLGAVEVAGLLIDELPADFPPDLRIRLTRNASNDFALRILDPMTTREARLQRALLLDDTAALRTLLRERNSDDVALQSARKLVPLAATSADWKDLAAAFVAHRQFAEATSAYRTLSEDTQYAAEAQYQLARIHFLNEDYASALLGYEAVATAFPGTDQERDATYQVANSLWRLRRYAEAEKAFLHYINQFQNKGASESVTRDLIDVYRSLGQNDKAIALIDGTLKKRTSAATRQVLLFTKAKILYGQAKYASSLLVIRQLKGSNLQATPGGTSSDELVYLEALCLAKTGNVTAAKAAWRRLAAKPESYYGQRSTQHLGGPPAITANAAACLADSDRTRADAIGRILQRQRPLLSDSAGATDAVTELVFLRLWDEASLWIDRIRRPDPALAADLSYVSGRYSRAITYADRMPVSNPDAQALLYPAGFRKTICQAAEQRGVDPLWLHAIIWQESKYNPDAHSSAAARGLMQFIPDTAEAIATATGVGDLTVDRLYDPETSIQLGAYYWSALLSEFKSPELALAAYNGGPENVRRWRDKWPDSDGEFFVSDIGFTETKRYVQAVFSARAAYGRLN
jgi:peptidoglycan lytic transglycosylase